jgi:hypothetical protein
MGQLCCADPALLLALAVAAVLVIAALAWTGAARAEKYGPPPGRSRALSPDELDNRGWPQYPLDYTGNTASSVSHMVLRSA